MSVSRQVSSLCGIHSNTRR